MIADYIQNYAEQMATQLNGCISVNVFDTQKGESLAYYSRNFPDFDNRAAEHISQAVRETYEGLVHLHGMEGKMMKNMEITLDNQTHLLVFTRYRRLACYIILEEGKANLALTEQLHGKLYTEALMSCRNWVLSGNAENDPLLEIIPVQ